MLRLLMLISLFVLTGWSSLFAQEDDRDFLQMFNGQDLSGWQRVNTAESTWSYQDGMLVCTGKPIGELRTNRMYQNFTMELEWRHMVPKGNAGVFVWADDITAKGVPFHRGIEVQVLENAYGITQSHTTHGDIFPIHGASMTPVNGRDGQRAFPTEERSNPSPEWNHYRITCIDGDISLAVNGKVVTQGKDCNPHKGYICIESEGGVVHYRNVKIKELPDTPIDEKMIAIADRGFRCLYNGIDLNNWDGASAEWQPNDWVLAYRGAANESAKLSTQEKFKDFNFLFDMKRKTPDSSLTLILPGEDVVLMFDSDDKSLFQHLSKPGSWDRIFGSFLGDELTIQINGENVLTRTLKRTEPGPLRFAPAGDIDFANIYVSGAVEDEISNRVSD